MTGIILELALIVVLVLINGVFALSELAVVSARKARLQQRADAGQAGAREALRLANEPDRFLSTIQIGITLVGILAGALGGATLAGYLASQFAAIPFLAPYSDTLGLVLVVLFIGYLSLILGELVPKQIALSDPERFAALVARPMRFLSSATGPVVSGLSASTALVLRLLGIRPSPEPSITEEEIKILIEQGTRSGVILPVEQSMIEKIFRLGDLRVGAIMTPRPEVVWLDSTDPPEAIIQTVLEHQFRYYPVGQGSLDQVVGVVTARGILAARVQGDGFDLLALAEQPLFVPESTPALRVLDSFRQHGTHFAVVIDEFGGFDGIVTDTDVLESIAGDLPLAGETVEPDLVRRDDGSWLVSGSMPIDDFLEAVPVGPIPEDERGSYQTVGGFALARLGHIPAIAERFPWGECTFEIVDLDRRRIDKILVSQEARDVGTPPGANRNLA